MAPSIVWPPAPRRQLPSMPSLTRTFGCLIFVLFCGHKCAGWSTPTLPPMSIQKLRVNQDAIQFASGRPTKLPLLWNQPLLDFLSTALVVRIVPPILAASLLFGVVDTAIASDEALLFDLSKEDSGIVESRSPPEIQTTTSARSLALSTKMKAMNAKMYGAYWCRFCAKQKEAFGKEAFETKNIGYVECSEDGHDSQAATLCREKNIQGFPTWEINGKLYSGERNLDEMEVLIRMAEAASPGRDKAAPLILTSSSQRAMAISSQLKSLDAILFGAYWDPYTFEAKERLGAGAMTQIPYIECGKDGENSQLDLCKEKGVQVIPTWSVAGRLYPGDKYLEELEEIIASTTSPSPLSATETSGPVAKDDDPPKIADPMSKKIQSASTAITTTSTITTLTLAKQMESLNTRMYGAYFCTHCSDQKNLFGKEAFEKIHYVECAQDGQDSQLPLCRARGITSVPTWEINDKLFVGERSIDQLQGLVAAELLQDH